MLKIDKNIKFILTDFDGIITDGFLYLSTSSNEQQKRVSFKDIMGLSLAINNGYKVGIVSGENNSIIDSIAKKFKIDDVHKGIKDKVAVLKCICKKYNITPEHICYIGDDVNDIEVLKLVKYPITVPNANFKVKKVNGVQITSANGGNGAFRELIDSIIY